MTLSELDFSTGEYWIQVHELPLELINSQNAEILGGQLGTLLEKETFRREFLRIKVLIPLLQPLVSGFYQDRQGKPPSWVQLKYERLSEFCFTCGKLGHVKLFCPAGPPSNLPKIPKPFGPDMHAKTPSIQKTVNVHTPRKEINFPTIPSLMVSSNPFVPSPTMSKGKSHASATSSSTPAPMDTSESLCSILTQSKISQNQPNPSHQSPSPSLPHYPYKTVTIPQMINSPSSPQPTLESNLTIPTYHFSLNTPPLAQAFSIPPVPSQCHLSPDSPPSITTRPFSFSNNQNNPHVFKSLITDIEDISDLFLKPSTCPDSSFPLLTLTPSDVLPLS
jgi:hypothetical protein